MISSQRFSVKLAFFILIIFQLFSMGCARLINECLTVTTGAAEYIQNPNVECSSEYPLIYCNGASSAYCTQEECMEEFVCETSDVTEVDNVSITTSQSKSTNGVVSTTESYFTNENESSSSESTTAPSSLAYLPETSSLPTSTITITTAGTPSTTTSIPTTEITTTFVPAAVNIRKVCRVGVSGNFPYLRNCRYYYHCTDGYFVIQDCGFYMSFDVVDGYCKSTRVARCFGRIWSNNIFWNFKKFN
ncbi:uncharacterized protein [Eurosta solidaginis]|uniref:uncharacterized protein n=1 Tax=Eurosta solidaginis TaxID=178769 RepID=UPI0035305AC2